MEQTERQTLAGYDSVLKFASQNGLRRQYPCFAGILQNITRKGGGCIGYFRHIFSYP